MKRAILALMVSAGLSSMAFATGNNGGDNPPASSQTPIKTAVTGVAGEQFGASFGGPNAGSNVMGWSGASFDGSGGKSSGGTADVFGSGGGKGVTSPGSAFGSGQTWVQSTVTLDAFGKMSVAGGTEQADWAHVVGSNKDNYAGSFNDTGAMYDGTGTRGGSASGSAFGAGWSSAYSRQSANFVESGASTFGRSGAEMQGARGTLNAMGNGVIGGSSMLGTPGAGTYAGGTFYGTALYGGGSQGSLTINGLANGTFGPGSVSAGAHVDSSAMANGLTMPSIMKCDCMKDGGH